MSLFQSISDWIYREYDRRIKRASLITEYGEVHHSTAHDDYTHANSVVQQPQAVLAETQSDDDDAESVIINVPRGTVVAADDDDDDAVEIVNVPRGTVVPRNDDTTV